MVSIATTISRFVDEHQPGFVECRVTDANGRVHIFIEKVPIISDRNLSSDSEYPCRGSIACTIVESLKDESGREIVRVDTTHPHGIESLAGESQFLILPSELER